MRFSTNMFRHLLATTLVLIAAAAMAAPTVAARGALDSWHQNLNAREEFAQMTDSWALNLIARQTHRDGGYAIASGDQGTASATVGARSGFDWSDAGIGAAGVCGVILLAAAIAKGTRGSSLRPHTTK